MRNLPVHWSEGMFLRPHQFQAAERYWTEALQTSEQWDHAYNYGLRRIELSEEAISNYQFQLEVCRARMADGTLISLDVGQEPDRTDLKDAVTGLQQALIGLEDAFEKEAVIRVYLAVPKLKLGNANVVRPDVEGKHRFVSRQASFQDETTGGNDQEVEQLQLNVRVLLSTEDLTGYELLPIAQIRRSGEREALPELDASYIPPVLAIDAWRPLGRDIVRALYDFIGQKIEVFSEQTRGSGFTFEGRESGDLDRLFLLSVLNAAYCTLGQLCFASGVHPFTAYTELCRIAGMLSVFGEKRRAPELPAYDHDDLARIFRYVRQQIEMLISRVRETVYERRYFEGSGLGMLVSLQSHWFHSDWKWYVGVDKGDLTEEECRALLSPRLLDWNGRGELTRTKASRSSG